MLADQTGRFLLLVELVNVVEIRLKERRFALKSITSTLAVHPAGGTRRDIEVALALVITERGGIALSLSLLFLCD